jgi:hypothetical protein
MQDLNNLIPSGTGVTLEEPWKINKNGQIAGLCSDGGFVLTPTSGAAASIRMASSSRANATAASSGTTVPLEMGTASSDGTSSLFPRGPVGLVADTPQRIVPHVEVNRTRLALTHWTAGVQPRLWKAHHPSIVDWRGAAGHIRRSSGID